MALTLYYHPLSSYCWKVLTALYENEIACELQLVDLSDPAERAQFLALWPIGKFPLLRDHTRGTLTPESSIIIEYLAQHYPGRTALIPADPDAARDVRRVDRFFDLYVHDPMQKIVGDKLRPADQRDAYGVAAARARLEVSYGILEQQLSARGWAVGDTFTLADCSAAPALHYADRVAPLGAHSNVAAYLERLHARKSFARVYAEAQPYLAMFPG